MESLGLPVTSTENTAESRLHCMLDTRQLRENGGKDPKNTKEAV